MWKSTFDKERFCCYDNYESPIYKFLKEQAIKAQKSDSKENHTWISIKQAEDERKEKKFATRLFQRNLDAICREREQLKKIFTDVRREALRTLLRREEQEQEQALQDLVYTPPPELAALLPPIPGLSIHANRPPHLRPPITFPLPPLPPPEDRPLPPLLPVPLRQRSKMDTVRSTEVLLDLFPRPPMSDTESSPEPSPAGVAKSAANLESSTSSSIKGISTHARDPSSRLNFDTSAGTSGMGAGRSPERRGRSAYSLRALTSGLGQARASSGLAKTGRRSKRVSFVCDRDD